MKLFVCVQGDGWVYRNTLWKTHWRKEDERRSDEHRDWKQTAKIKNRRIMNNNTTDCTEPSVYTGEHGHIEQTFYTLYKWYIIFHDYNRAFVDMHMYTVFMWSAIRWFVNGVKESWIYIQCSESNLNCHYFSSYFTPIFYINIYSLI